MLRALLWLCAATISVALTILIFFPAAWLASMLEMQTAGRLTLGDARGTLWRGSAFIGGAPSGKDPVTPLLPGRFSWRLSPMVLLGRVEAEVENAAALSTVVTLSGNWQRWQVSPAAIVLPAERLAALGTPLNTVQPTGQMRLTWNVLQLLRQKNTIEMRGVTHLELQNIASRLSPVKPLGSYDVAFDWQGAQAAVTLTTVTGPMLLSGSGIFKNGRLRFSGQAEAATGQEERLANLLNLLGQRRQQDGKNIIALEFN